MHGTSTARAPHAAQELALQETVSARQTEVAQLRSLLREAQATAADQKQALLDLQVLCRSWPMRTLVYCGSRRVACLVVRAGGPTGGVGVAGG